MHVISSDTASFELKINYISYVYNLIKNNQPVRKGDIGVTLDLVVLGIAKMNYKLVNSPVSVNIEKNIMKTGGTPEVIIISEISPNSDAYK